jgi:hypothetical protein
LSAYQRSLQPGLLFEAFAADAGGTGAYILGFGAGNLQLRAAQLFLFGHFRARVENKGESGKRQAVVGRCR